MRSVPVAILLLASFVLAGCAGGGDDDHIHYQCPGGGPEIHGEDHPSANTTADLAKFCPSTGTGGSATSTTTQAPNIPPVLVVKTFDSMGNETKVTLLRGNLTFSAEGSSDPDGEISGIAVTVTDSNQTRTASLYDAVSRQFKTATFTFDRPGVVNVTVAMVDDRAGFTVNQSHVYVNHLQTLGPQSILLPGGIGGNCDEADLTNAQYYKPMDFTVAANASFIEATITSGSGTLTICSPPPEPRAISNTGSSVVTNEGEALPAAVGTQSYFVGVKRSPSASTSSDITISVLVHYEPREAAAAE
jgi:hypothetical protein